MLESGLHRVALVFGLVSIALWTYVFHEWWGGEWWVFPLAAAAAAIPVGVVFGILRSTLLQALLRVPQANDTVLIWAETSASGIGYSYVRRNAMRVS